MAGLRGTPSSRFNTGDERMNVLRPAVNMRQKEFQYVP